jgi:CheY-like chemotaxis protein
MKTSGNQKYQILVVDDEPMVCRALKMLLKFDGHEVQTVESGEAALALFELNHFDLIITDYSLGLMGMKGDQLAATIKQRWPDQPIIMATAFAADFPPSSKPSGAVDYVLSKPFSLIELREAIACVMSRNESPSPSASALDPTIVRPPEVPPPSHPGEDGSGRKWT